MGSPLPTSSWGWAPPCLVFTGTGLRRLTAHFRRIDGLYAAADAIASASSIDVQPLPFDCAASGVLLRVERLHLLVPAATGHGSPDGAQCPHGELRKLVHNLTFELRHGQRLLVCGASGAGKTTLLRAVAGVWAHGNGEIRRARGCTVMFLPQRPYMPLLGTMRQQLLYAGTASPVAPSDAQLQSFLCAVGLAHLIDLDRVRPWTEQLSLGEQQRVAVCRALVRRPELLVVDEATSAIDESAEAAIYALLCGCSSVLLSVGHRATLRRFHDRVLLLRDGSWQFSSCAEAAAVPGASAAGDAYGADTKRPRHAGDQPTGDGQTRSE